MIDETRKMLPANDLEKLESANVDWDDIHLVLFFLILPIRKPLHENERFELRED